MLINFDMWNVMYTAEKCLIMITLVFCLQPENNIEFLIGCMKLHN